MIDKSRLLGHLAVATAYIIFGFNIIFCKDIANSHTISPAVLFTVRAIGASALFWLLSLFLPKERMSGKDILMTALASVLGLFIPQFTFLAATTMTTATIAIIANCLLSMISVGCIIQLEDPKLCI